MESIPGETGLPVMMGAVGRPEWGTGPSPGEAAALHGTEERDGPCRALEEDNSGLLLRGRRQ